jgi:DNA-binding CsgD family transcriptional regulator
MRVAPRAPSDDEPGLARLRLFDGLLRIAERLAADGPFVAVIEDLQWADDASLALLSYLRHNLRRGPILLVLTARTDEVTGQGLVFLADLERDERMERIELAGLGIEDTVQQLAAILGRRPERPLVAGIQALSGGNPFFAEELLAAGQEGSSGWDGTVSGGGFSPRLRDVLRARTERLPDIGRTVLRAASTTDRVVEGQMLARISGLDVAAVEEGLRSALEAQLLVRVSAASVSGYRFRHELVRTFVASELQPTESARLHAGFATALIAISGPWRSPGELAYHWDAAGDEPRAFAAHVEAGLDAEAACAFEVAQAHFERAFELWERVPDADDRTSLDRLHLIQRAADAAARAGHLDRAIELARLVLAAGGHDEADLHAYMGSALRWYLWMEGRIDEAIAEAERAVAELGTEPVLPGLTAAESGRWRANALGHLAGLRMIHGDLAVARRDATEALRVAEAVGAAAEAALGRGVLGWCLIHAGEVDEGIGQIRAVWQAARDLGKSHLAGTALAYGQLARALELVGRAEEAVVVASEGVEWSTGHGLGSTFGAALDAVRARALYHLGRWREASEVVAAGLDGGAVGPGRFGLHVADALLGAAQGREEAVGDRLPLASAGPTSLADTTGADDPAGWLVAALCERALWGSEPAAALDRLGATLLADDAADREREARGRDGRGREGHVRAPAAEGTFDASRPRQLALTARAFADVRLRDRAAGTTPTSRDTASIRLVGKELRRLERRGALADAWRHDLACARAELQRAHGTDPGKEAELWKRAAEAASGLRRPYVEAYACWRRAEALIAHRGERSAASAEVRRGLELASDLGAGPLLRELELLARRARLAIAKGSAGPAERADVERGPAVPFGLTERELEVLVLLTAGDTNREIGEKLFISPKTASVHVSNILGKMGVDGRVEAAGLALRLGLAGTASGEGAPRAR